MHIISGRFKSRKLSAPKGDKTRPTSGRLREALFNICQHQIEGARFLDLFAGSGAMGIEALSRGAARSVFVDTSRDSIRCIHANVEAFGLEADSEIMCLDVFEAMSKLAKRGYSFDIIYADPPYGQIEKTKGNALSQHVATILDGLIDMKLPLLKPGGALFLEDDSESLSERQVFKHLTLLDSRKMGHSALQRWSYPEGSKE